MVIIECPSCMTRFRLDESRLTGQKKPLLKCSRCQHVFPAPTSIGTVAAEPIEKEEEPAPAGQLPSPNDADNMSFSFDEEALEAEPPDEPGFEEEQFSLSVPKEEEVEPESPPDVADDKAELHPATASVSGEEETSAPLAESTPDSEDATDDAKRTIRPVFFFLVLVVTSYAVLAGTLYANPDWTDQVVRGMPLVGSVRGQSMNRKVLLVELGGAYQRTKAGKNILIVTGYAVNHAEVALSSVQIGAQLLDSTGEAVADRVVFCGSTVPRKLLRDLTLAEVSIIGRLKPPSTFLLHPGDRSPFMAVFPDPPPTITEFRTRVVAAQRQV